MTAAYTQFVRGGANDALIPEVWETVDYEFAFAKDPTVMYMAAAGSSSYGNMPIMVTKKLGKGVGDTIHLPMILPLLNDGETNDGDYDGNAKKLDFIDSDVTIAERGITVPTAGQYTIQINYHGADLPGGVTRKQLAEWVGSVLYSDKIAGLSGIPATQLDAGWVTGAKAVDADGDPIKTVNCYTPSGTAAAATEYGLWFTSGKSATHPRIFCGGQDSSTGAVQRVANDAAITAYSNGDHIFGTAVIDYVRSMAIKEDAVNSGSTRIVIPPIEPIMVDGNERWIMLITPEQANDLRKDTAWINANLHANVDGPGNPIYSGMLGIWNNVVIKECPRLHKRTGAGGTTTGIVASEYFDGLPYNATYTPTQRDLVAEDVSVGRAVFFGKNALLQAWGKEPSYSRGVLDPGSNTKPSMHVDMIYGVKIPVFSYLDTRTGGEDTRKMPVGVILVDTAIQI